MLWRVAKVTEATALAIVSEEGHGLGPEQYFLRGPDAILFVSKLFVSGSDGSDEGSTLSYLPKQKWSSDLANLHTQSTDTKQATRIKEYHN